MLRREVRVAHRGDDAFMAHQVLNGPKVNPPHHQPAGEGVSQTVPRELEYPRLFANFGKQLVWWLNRKDIWGPRHPSQNHECLTQNAVHLDVLALAVLASGQSNDSTLKVDVLPL